MSFSEPRRFRLRVAYDGTAFAGFQMQRGVRSVQEELERALSKLYKRERVVVHGASRTDAGVHALGQVTHFDAPGNIPAEKLAFALNTLLPEDLRVLESSEAGPDFHARFSATGKVYRYSIYNARHYDPLLRLTHAHIPVPLDLALMRAELQPVVGSHDFAAFAAAGSVAKSTTRTLHRIEISGEAPCIQITVHGNAFLYNMVRILAGTLIDVGRGLASPGAFQRALASGSRLDLGITAPACGLTLLRVFYGDDAQAAQYFDTNLHTLATPLR